MDESISRNVKTACLSVHGRFGAFVDLMCAPTAAIGGLRTLLRT